MTNKKVNNTVFERIKGLIYGTEEKRKILGNITWLISDKIVRYVLSFFIGIWVVRYLGPERFGLFSYAMAFTGILGTFVGLGMGQILIRELIKHPEQHDQMMGSAFWLSLFSSIGIAISAIAMILLIRPNDEDTILLIAIICITYGFKPFYVIDCYFAANVQQKYIVPVSIIGSLLTGAFKIFLILRMSSLLYFAWAVVLEQLVIAIGIAYMYWIKTGKGISNWAFDKSIAKLLLRDSLPLMLSATMIAVFMQIDQIMIREMVGSKEAGLYSVAVTISSLCAFLPGIIVASFFPKIVKLLNESDQLFNAQMQNLYRLVALICYVIVIPISLFANPIVTYLYGDAFASSGGMLSILIWAILPGGFGVVKNSYIYAKNLTKTLFIITTLGALLNIGLNYLFIPMYQGMGAVISTLISYTFTAFLSNFLYKSLRPNAMMMMKALVYPRIF